jgi:molybdate transport system substrate-binding protein
LSASVALAGLIFFGNCTSRQPTNGREIIVAAASDLTPAFKELGLLFEQQTGVKVTFMFGSTGNLAKQIENGAPVDLFAAANISFIEQLEQKGFIVADTKALYARGRITLWTRADSSLEITKLEDLARPEIIRVAIANPEHAPYGIAAREALERAGVWSAVEPKLVLGENIRQAFQYAETGNVEAAIVALSLSVNSNGRWALVPEELHSPLDQMLAVIKTSGNSERAREFAAFINSAEGRAVMRKYGFTLPGEETAH